MNAENPVQIDRFGVPATRTKDTRLAEQSGGFLCHRLGQHRSPVLRKSRAAGGQNEHLESVPAKW